MSRPPAVPSALLRWSLPPGELREFILGDLLEEHRNRRARSSGLRAGAWYWREALSVVASRLVGAARGRLSRGGSFAPTLGPGGPRRRDVAPRGLTGLAGDLRYALRNMARRPLFSSVAIGSLALGIGSTTLIFSGINAMFLRPPAHVVEPQRLAAVFTGGAEGARFSVSSYPDFLDVRREIDAFDDVAAYIIGVEMGLSSERQTQLIFGEAVSANYFDVLGVSPALGRFFAATDLVDGGVADEVVIGHGLWQREFAGDAGVLGRPLRLDGRTRIIVGVAPAGLRTLQFPVQPDAWVPLSSVRDRGGDEWLRQRGNRGLNLVARLSPEASLEGAQQQLEVLAGRLREEYPRLWSTTSSGARGFSVLGEAQARLSPGDRGAVAGVATFLMVIVVLVLAIACSNLANLLLSRAWSRRSETAVRLALGASRARLMRLLLTESVVLAVIAGAIGVLLAHALTQWIARGGLFGALPFQIDLTVDRTVLGFALATSTLTGILFGLAPALRASRPDLLSALKGAGGDSRRRWMNLRNGLIVGQIAVSLVLLVTASLFLRSLYAATHLDLGFDPQGVATIQIDLSQSDTGDDETAQFFDDVTSRLRRAPHVESVALAYLLPLGGVNQRWTVDIEGYEPADGQMAQVGVNIVSPEYLGVMRMRLLAGRDLSDEDRAGSPPVGLVNEAFVRRYSPAGSMLGRHIEVGEASISVVGVVATAKYRSLSEDPEPRMWVPLAQHAQPRLTLLARTSDDAETLLPLLRREVLGLQPELPLRAPGLLADIVATSMMPQRMATMVLGAAGGIALVLAVVGIYGVVAFGVSRRTREIGVRIALGAQGAEVMRMIVAEACLLVGVGVVIGLPVVLLLARLIGSMLMGISPADPLSMAAGGALLAAAAMVASVVPARRATRVDPLVALRAE